MKQEIWMCVDGYLCGKKVLPDDTLLGTIDIEPVKKVVTKDSVIIPIASTVFIMGKNMIVEELPKNAINPRIVYDIEE